MPSRDELDYEIVDVFAPGPFAGNPLAVVFGADALTTAQCQALAFEFHLSETSFLCAPTEPGADYRVRIFTPFAELPFAGHPSVGAAHTLVRTGRLPAGTVRQECGAGVLDLLVDDRGATLSGGRPTLEDGPPPAELAAALGLSETDVTGVPADVAGCGLPFAYLSVRSGAVDRAVPDQRTLDALGVGRASRCCPGMPRPPPPTPACSPATCAGARTRPPARLRWAPASGWWRAACWRPRGRRPTSSGRGEAGSAVGARVHRDRCRRPCRGSDRARGRRPDRAWPHPRARMTKDPAPSPSLRSDRASGRGHG
ncbi:PhzF family phenazine biosynthesis protein [Blastococcus brunescens]|uniref:PhzF family phenazine biosynthesis protein n=1 Tax=Blastococcus brunescens TaxID=1564165 RepID=A0ABZ1B2J1_9ACTN|nr:PhzF family phenazine biosynthesis protein [Blastococcus sp. BMG 8361]WRL64964.1 PhzF family phenazine biosynthesis protein [Blastococcus sp. BMG 8361]